jgi:hypothetical protein
MLMAKATKSNPKESRPELVLQYAAENRRAEISLLWARSSFFWAFLAIAIASFGSAIHFEHRTIALIVACFAAVCSLCWTLANRAGKYWQEVWEKKVERIEQEALGQILFSRKSNPDIPESWFWGAKQYSPSRLAIAVSDLALALWSILALGIVLINFPHSITLIRIAILMFTAVYGAGILVWCKSRANHPSNIRQAWSELSAAMRDPIISNRDTAQKG